MTASVSVRKTALLPISTRVEADRHGGMLKLAKANGRSVGEEYRAAVAAWVARPSNASLLAQGKKAVA